MYITLDVGGTNIRVGAFDKLDSPTLLYSEKFEHDGSFEEDLKRIETVIRAIEYSPLEAIGLSVAGVVNDDKTGLAYSPNLQLWVDINIVQSFSHLFHVPIFLINDAEAGALGELSYGIQLEQPFLYLIWGTGIGGAVLKPTPLLAQNIEPGHTITVKDELTQERVEWEAASGGAAIDERFKRGILDLSDDNWEKILGEMTEGVERLTDKTDIRTLVVNGGVALHNPKRVAALQKRLLELKPPVMLYQALLKDQSALYGGLVVISENL